MKTEKHRRWKNVGGNESSKPAMSFWPQSLEDLQEIIALAEQSETTVRAIGASHSWSDIAKTEDYLIYTNRLNRILDLEAYSLQSDLAFQKERLIWVQCGITVREMNQALDARGLALINLGGFDGQTICGMTSTSTHGSGIAFGPLSDFIKSIEIVVNQGKVYRIEPSPPSGNTLTNPKDYRRTHPDPARHELIQDDQWFQAVTVGMGCMGLIYSVVLEVREAFMLKETRTLTTWSQVKEVLKNGAIYQTPDHYELLLNPYLVDGQNRCLITSRVETNKPGDPERSIYIKYRAALDVSALWVKILSWLWPSKIKETLNTAISALQDDDYTARSHKVFHIGEANDIMVISSEFAVPLDQDAYLAAIDRLLNVAELLGKEENLYLTVPLAVRFVKATAALLSPMHARDTCMLEVIALADVKRSKRIMERIEEALAAHSVRPHWGQLNHVTPARMLEMYGAAYGSWLEIERKLNPRGTFASPFSRRVGIDPP